MNKEENRYDEENPFKLINKVDELPPALKRKVMATINFAHLAADLGKLFSVDMANTAIKLVEPDIEEQIINRKSNGREN